MTVALVDTNKLTTPGATIAFLKNEAWVHWRMLPRPGRLEELEWSDSRSLGMSISYGCGSVRVRFMRGRRWVSWIDLPATRMAEHQLLFFHSQCEAFLCGGVR